MVANDNIWLSCAVTMNCNQCGVDKWPVLCQSCRRYRMQSLWKSNLKAHFVDYLYKPKSTFNFCLKSHLSKTLLLKMLKCLIRKTENHLIRIELENRNWDNRWRIQNWGHTIKQKKLWQHYALGQHWDRNISPIHSTSTRRLFRRLSIILHVAYPISRKIC